eukprot:CAMPEP_0197666392 /NCGR_PEP_ID=MMETSP1338-20131121/62357_1 /TAXON_ID=43686 ORGANISM="Pelagodinium beii, Strain RCC1491" /NCGR_SAMPLE_ID=MMETSP1338 /ASSEMBLY_ACC=CAM_ASM_000754 /LENGTH=75 /DNA_ID=CAMNT_0043245411 /DNA_START=182 /DNA_END=410 /DNA_ORIENTATION=-
MSPAKVTCSCFFSAGASATPASAASALATARRSSSSSEAFEDSPAAQVAAPQHLTVASFRFFQHELLLVRVALEA